jgi:signal transduction histidine kinase
MLTGLAIVQPQKIHYNQLPPSIVIERMSVDGRVLPIPGASQLLGNELSTNVLKATEHPLEVPPRNRDVRIDFSALSFTAPENVRVRYQLEGYDSGWVTTTQRSAAYAQLPAGEYRFHVAACNDSGIWNEAGAMLGFRVRPFFWQTWWFRVEVLAAMTAGLIGMGYYASSRRLRRKLFRLEQESAVQKDRARIAKDLHDDLGANLSQIAMLSELAQTDLEKPAQAHEHLDQIFRTARLITRSLDEIVWAVNPRNDTLDRFVAHVCQFVPEYLRAAGIRARLDMPMELPASTLPANVRHQLYLGLKETLHNVVKHAGATEVWLRLQITGKTITLVVEDNGRGFETAPAPGIGADGLMNLRHRMEEAGGEFRQESERGKGTRITFIVPLAGKSV